MRDEVVRKSQWWIAVILAGSSALNYLDRQTLPILIGTIQKEIHFTDLQYSYVTAVFLAGYTAMTAVSGRILDIVGTRKGLAFAVAIWSIASSIHFACRSAVQFAIARLALALGESANFPAGVKGVTERFPLKDRAFAVGIFNSGSSLGAAIGAPLISFAALLCGWRWTFAITGLLGFIWIAVFLFAVRDPVRREDRERKDDPVAGQQYSLFQLLGSRRAWGCFVARIFIDPVTYFLIFWVPRFLQTERGFGLTDIGRFLWAPYLALSIGTVIGGYVPAQLVRVGWTVNRARKSIMLISTGTIVVSCFVIVGSKSSALVLVALGAFMFAHGAWGNITIPAEVFDSKVVGTVSGLGGTLGGIAGIIAQVLIGAVLLKHSFAPLFLFAGLLYTFAFGSLCLLIKQLGSTQVAMPGEALQPAGVPGGGKDTSD
jgi:MFS transporter, ACS family, hexuronate transporter